MKPVTPLDVKTAELNVLKKRLEAMALLARQLTNVYVSDTHKQEFVELIDGLSHTKGGKYYD